MIVFIFDLLDMLQDEVNKVEMSQYIGLECDSDEEEMEDGSDTDYSSDDDSTRYVVGYDIDKMFEIINYRDFRQWSVEHIANRFRKIHTGDSGRKQLSR